MSYKHSFTRHKTREVMIGNRVIGGNNPILVQSMTTPDTHFVEEVIKQIHALEEAGC
jgi:(E)-4-hydroxy-3-methylbut-2-enyl-diphosphate synthase